MAMLAVPVPKEISYLFQQVDIPGNRDLSDHITLFCFGDNVPLDKLTVIISSVSRALSETKPFSVRSKRIVTFPKGDDGYPVIAELASKELVEIRNKIKKIFDHRGITYKDDFPDFKPHVTLSHSKKRPKIVRFDPVDWPVTEIALFGGDNGKDKLFVNFPFGLSMKTKSCYIEKLVEKFASLSERV